MSLKTLGIVTRGLLKRGAKKALNIATRGLIRFDVRKGKPVSPPFIPTGSPLTIDIDPVAANNVALITVLDDIF